MSISTLFWLFYSKEKRKNIIKIYFFICWILLYGILLLYTIHNVGRYQGSTYVPTRGGRKTNEKYHSNTNTVSFYSDNNNSENNISFLSYGNCDRCEDVISLQRRSVSMPWCLESILFNVMVMRLYIVCKNLYIQHSLCISWCLSAQWYQFGWAVNSSMLTML